MSRGNTRSTARCVVVWLGVSAVCAFGLQSSAPLVARLWHGRGASAAFAELLVQVSAVVLTGALAWLWVITTLTVATVLRGRVPHRSGQARRLVLLLCGAALTAGVAAPASAQGGDAAGVLVGLSLPDRVSVPAAGPVDTAPAPAPAPAPSAAPGPETASGGHHVVAKGDSLWSIARSTSPPGTDLAVRWRQVWEANREVVGDDPDLILPGQRLTLPRAVDNGQTTHDGPDGSTR